MRALAFPLVALVLLVTAPPPGWSQSLGELYRQASPSVVVIRAKGREVTTGGVARFGETGLGRARLAGWEGRHRVARRPRDGRHHGGVPRRRTRCVRRVIGFQPSADLALLQLDAVPPDAPVGTIADSSDPWTSEIAVFIIGAPYGLTYALSTRHRQRPLDARTP